MSIIVGLLVIFGFLLLIALAAAVLLSAQPPGPTDAEIEEWLNQHRIDDSDETKGA